MASEWRLAKVGEIAEKVAIGPFGSSIKVETFVPAGVPVISGQHLHGWRLDENVGFNFISPDHAERLKNAIVHRGDVIFTHSGNVGQVSYIPENSKFDRYVISQRQFYMRCDRSKVIPEFVVAYFKTAEGQHKLLANMSQVGVPAIAQPVTHLRKIEIPLPSLPEQRAIAHILGTLDDKIELNRRMSETLEQMARAIFKAWFVDFEPVRAKMEGRWQRGQSLPGLPAHLYDLFPDRLVESELGEIPEGWRVARMGDVLAELVSGSRPKGGAVEEGVPSVGAENVIGLGKYDFSKEKYIPREFFEELQRKGSVVRPGDVLLYKDGAQIGRKTYFDCGFPHTECAVNEHVFILRAQHPRYQRYLFFWLDQDWMTQEIISLNSNSAQPGINQQGVRSLPCLIPPDPVLDAFDHFLKPLTDRLFSSCFESRTLAALRDALLPKLIRGEIRVKDAERFLEERGL